MPDFATLLARPRTKLPPPLDKETVRLYAYGRVALYHGLRLLGILPGENVLMPSLICAPVIAPFKALCINAHKQTEGERCHIENE